MICPSTKARCLENCTVLRFGGRQRTCKVEYRKMATQKAIDARFNASMQENHRSTRITEPVANDYFTHMANKHG